MTVRTTIDASAWLSKYLKGADRDSDLAGRCWVHSLRRSRAPSSLGLNSRSPSRNPQNPWPGMTGDGVESQHALVKGLKRPSAHWART